MPLPDKAAPPQVRSCPQYTPARDIARISQRGCFFDNIGSRAPQKAERKLTKHFPSEISQACAVLGTTMLSVSEPITSHLSSIATDARLLILYLSTIYIR